MHNMKNSLVILKSVITKRDSGRGSVGRAVASEVWIQSLGQNDVDRMLALCQFNKTKVFNEWIERWNTRAKQKLM